MDFTFSHGHSKLNKFKAIQIKQELWECVQWWCMHGEKWNRGGRIRWAAWAGFQQRTHMAGIRKRDDTRPQQAGRNAWKTRPLIFQEFSKAKFCFIILSMCTFVTTYPLEIRVESPNHTEPTDFWRIQAGGKNDTIVFIGTSFEKILSFLPMDRICIKTRFPNRATCGICL